MKRMIVRAVAGLAVCAVLVACLAPPAWADTLVLKQGVGGYTGCTDTYIAEEDYPGTNHGTVWYMHLYMQSDDPEASGLVKFDLSPLPAGATITGATLSLWVYQVVDMTSGDWLDVAPIRVRNFKTWTETGATWHLFSGSSLWATPGCESPLWDRFAAPDPETAAVQFTRDSLVNRYYHWNVTSAVEDWYADTMQNNGWLVRVLEHDGGSEGISLNAKESSSLAYRPYLTIEYVPIPEPATLGLVALGIAGIAARRKRKTRASS